MNDTIGRRDAAKRMLMVVGAAAVVPAALSACGEKEPEGLSCTDTAGLTPQELTTRQSQNYVDQSPHADKTCDNCNFWEPGQPNQCGGCTVIAGPIHPDGYCNLWAAKI